MDIEDAQFPFLRLPKKAMKCVIQIMEIKQQLSLSLCTKSLKDEVKSLKTKCSRFDVVSFDEVIFIEICFESDRERFILFFKNEWITRSVKTTRVQVVTGNFIFEYWKSPLNQFKEWIHHLLAIFNYSKIDTVNCSEVWNDVELFHETFSGIEVKNLIIQFEQNDDCRYVFNSIIPRRDLHLFRNPYQNIEQEKIGMLLMQNLETLGLHRGFNLTFDHVLLINSREMVIANDEIDEKFLNKYIKHWIGGANPRTERIAITFLRVFENLNQNAVLKGVRLRTLALGENHTLGRS